MTPAPIAIIGIGLRLPGADNLGQLWDHLAAGRSLISEVPAQRWDKEALRGNPSRDHKTNSIWGGFVADADCFDADFFAISPREAAWMDPQQRFALEMAWHAIEDAGYRASDLAGSRTGVFMGVCHWDYAELLEKHLATVDAYTPTGIAFSIIANRVSHFFDLRGPSVTNDTACAASLTALHDAALALRAGQCTQALAGGVNLIWSPNHFVAFAKAGMLSKDGRAKAFDEAADGYVRGEGGAMVLLKPLDQALADGDAIHGVIRGIGVNHGGRTNSLTVTNPQAQADLIVEVFQGAGIAPETVSYIEAHGPGTPLGDPIEIAGLKQAFARLHAEGGTTPRPGAIGIGSVKTNMGHLEGAAGIAGLVKVLAALRQGQLPANVGFQQMNRLINLDGSDFRIQAQATPWPHDTDNPRRAGISSFGFGGSNAHMVVEEAPPQTTPAPLSGIMALPLSARDPERLRILAAAMRDYAAQPPADVTLADFAHTLQVGRQTFETRALVSAETWEQARDAFDALAKGENHPALTADGLAQAWVDGADIAWPALAARRIHAPLYPFDRQRHWLDLSVPTKDDGAVPHPLLHRNQSDFDALRWQTTLHGDEPVWADHHVGAKQVLPGMAALEMARAALQGNQWAFTDWVWSRPVLGGDGATIVDTTLTRQADGTIAFALSQNGESRAQGNLRPLAEPAPAALDLEACRAAAPHRVDPKECYARLVKSGVRHGPAFQALTQVQAGDGFVLAQIKLNRRLQAGLAAMKLHPIILDAAIQAWVALDSQAPNGAAVPFACRRLMMYGPCEPVMWARVRPTNAPETQGLRRLDIELCDKDGNVRVAFHDLSLRVMAEEAQKQPALLVGGTWRPSPLSPAAGQPRGTVLFLAGLDADMPGAIHLPEPQADMAATAAQWYAVVHDTIRDRLRDHPRSCFLVLAAESLPSSLTLLLVAVLMTLRQEQPRCDTALVHVAGHASTDRLAALVAAESVRQDGWPQVRIDADGGRWAWCPEEITLPTARPSLDGEASYWITGGLGGLGQIFARWLLQHGAGQVILSGRSQIADDDPRLVELGPRVRYAACDLTDVRAVSTLVGAIPRLKGVIHAAGVLNDGYILTRAAAEEADVFAPKLAGTLALDHATKDVALDFLVLCSSVAAVFGNAGQAAYGAANAFLDGYAQHRAGLVAQGKRHGTTVSLAWPLWAEGGMGVDAATQAALTRRFGTEPMPSSAGLAALEAVLAAPGPTRTTVLYGPPEKLRHTLAQFGQASTPAEEPKDTGVVSAPPADLEARTRDFVRAILADVLHLEPGNIRVNRKLDEYGLDSIAIVEATSRLEEALGSLSKTLFFEYVDLAGIAKHLAAEHGAALVRHLGDAPATAPAQPERTTISVSHAPTAPGRGDHDIAIVGLSLKVSKAQDQQSFWDMLAKGLHGFEPYPADRWDHRALLHPERDVLGKTVVKTGCFLDDIAAFDPRYFRISQYEAELMAPEVRLFLQASVDAFEDAGYSRETLQTKLGGDVAVIMGSMTNEYDLFGFQNMLMRGSLASGSYTGTVPNMVSYFYGFTGPSYFLDTMCSASSTCIHEAVHMLRAGRTRMALAGGVSVMSHPQKLIATSQEHFTTKTAEVIRGYGLGADGTILGEGVGALVLKRLSDAERDGDHIYGVIRGTAISNAGIRNGFTVPNPHQQSAAITLALDDAGVTADTISYVEGHGSGTALGDPIEIKALTQAWRRHTDSVQTCPIGTVKSNVGHLLAASGLAGMVKVLMQMKHGMLAPSLHAETLNPNIAFEQTPFRVQRQLEPWVRSKDASGAELPRRAGITSIGAGGMNSHIVVEEYRAPPRAPAADDRPQVMVFSAMGENQLAEVIRRFHQHVLDHPEQSLADLAYTLQVGRNQLPCRLAFVATGRSRLMEILAAPIPQAGTHFIRSILDCDPLPAADPTDLEAVAAAWVSGGEVDWDALHAGRQPRRLSLPAYPFEKVRCWYPEWPDAPSVTHPLGSKLKLHPLVGENRSDLNGLRYATRLFLSELRDYTFKQDGQVRLLPLAAVEAPLALARIAGLDGPLTLCDLRVSEPPSWADANELTAQVDSNTIRIAIDGAPWAETRLTTAGPDTPLPTGNGQTMAAATFYENLRQRGFDFTPYLESVDHATRLPGGAIICTLVGAPPQQDRFKARQQIPAPALAAGFQALLTIASPGADRLIAVKRAGLTASLENIVQVVAAATPDGFGLWFVDGNGAVQASLHGVTMAAADSVTEPVATHVESDAPQARLADELRQQVAELLKFPAQQVGLRDSFHDLGFDSITLARLAAQLSTVYGITLSPAVFFEAEHIEALAAHLISRHKIAARPITARPLAVPQKVDRISAPAARRDAIAVIGMAGRFPGANDIETLFAKLLDGADLTGPAPDERAFTQSWRGGFVQDVDRFDAALFRVSPTEAERMDPQQRLMLETAWRCLEDAGYDADEMPADTAVFVGASALDYAKVLRQAGIAADGYGATGNSLAMIANRVSYYFNWHGPSETIDTACSSSLVALLRGAESIRSGHCRAALVGGVNLALAEDGFDGPAQSGMLAPDGRCKTFGASADGYGRGEGVVAVLLKRLDHAEADGDRVLGLLIGGAENHGGRAGALTAPSVAAQAQLIETAMAGIDPATISYVEAHGTGTALGDPVEANGLRRAYEKLMGTAIVPQPFVALGSLKANIGHLEAAAGLAGLVKILAAMAHERLPASLHCQPANPHLELAGSPFRLLRTAEDWPAADTPRRAGLSSFGFGGANVHVVVEDYRAPTPPRRAKLPPRPFADTRFWIRGRHDVTLVFTPFWDEAPAVAAAKPRRLVIAAGVDVAAGFGAELVSAPVRVEDLAPRLLALLQQSLASDTHVQLVVPMGAAAAGLGAMIDTAALESSRISGQVIEVAPGIPPAELARLLAAEGGDSRVRFDGHHRLARRWRDLPHVAAAPWRPRGVFLITGAMGGLGRLLAHHIATTNPGATLVLTGSKPLDAERAAQVETIRALGAVAAYRQVDMADAQAVAALVQHVVEVHGRLDVVLHCAGTLRDGWLKGKSTNDLAAVMAPKSGGAEALIDACGDVQLDALVLFSSLAGAFGNAGQADYAAANGVLAALAEARGLPVVAIDWPLWAEGGMTIDDATAETLFQRMGQRPLTSQAGLDALGRILAAKIPHAAVLAGDESRIRDFFDVKPSVVSAPAKDMPGDETASLAAKLAQLFAQAGGFAPGTIHPDVALEEYGIDSLMITRLNSALGDVFQSLPKTLFFQYRTLAEVAAHLSASQGAACQKWLAPSPPTQGKASREESIAIIGIAGRYPGADSLDQFWDNLAQGRDSVGEVPPERWDLTDFYCPDRDRAVAERRSYAKWGAFLDGFADFDPLFFKISPRDAAAMDPQERLFLMCAWAATEDAGYSPTRLAGRNPVGVFVGITKTGFALHGPFASEGGAMVSPQTSFASTANRVSHALNLTGPSVAVDTMCSSSLTALHQACESLRSGQATMAVAGGVNLYLHPDTFVELSAARMLSAHGRCAAFGAGADGFVPGEGVGCVVLKTLSQALADGDRIHAVIRSSAVNHGGRTNGYTVPNPAAQRDLVRQALAQAGLSARDVTYIEAHGTGTELGDPIEVEGLTQAFETDTAERGFCALGSVKSNIGHLEAAAGIAGLTKLVLALRHGQLPPTLHAQSVNPNLRLTDSPFMLQHALGPWPNGPRIAGLSSFGAGGANAHLIVAEAPAQPAAAIDTSSPQAIVLSARDDQRLRDYAASLLAVVENTAADMVPCLRDKLAEILAVATTDIDPAEDFDTLGLDANQRRTLLRWVESQWPGGDAATLAHLSSISQLAAQLGGHAAPKLALADIAYTLQVGRESMEQRLALVASTTIQLADRLRRWLAGEQGAAHSGRAALPGTPDDGQAAQWWQSDLDRLVSAWVGGLRVDWTALPRPVRPAIVSLPTYPFERRRFWLPAKPDTSAAIIAAPRGDAVLAAAMAALDDAIAPVLAGILAEHPQPVPALQRWRDAALALVGDHIPAADPWATWNRLRDDQGQSAQMVLAETCLRALPDILSGRVQATQVMFPDGRLDMVEAVYKDNEIAARFSRTLAQAAASFVTTSPLPRLRILEIGAGTGGTSEKVFEALARSWDRVAEYCYTDLSRAFLIHAQRRYGPSVPSLTTALFDVEKDVAGQDVTIGGYDLVIAANVLHATADMGRTLAHVRALLAPGGLLLVNETAAATLFTHVTFGLLEGWWRFTDPQRRIPGTPSLSPDSWRSLIAETGLEWVAGSSPDECALGQQVLAARAPGQPAERSLPPTPQPVAGVTPALGDGASLGQKIMRCLGQTLNMAPTDIDRQRPFADYGLDSILGAELVHLLRRDLGARLEHTDLFDHKNAAELEAFLARQIPEAPALITRPTAVRGEQPVAIVGYAGRFARSANAEELWAHLAAGRDLVTPVQRFDVDGLYQDRAPGSYGRHGSFIDDVAAFDPVFFGISGLEARYMDPQQRLFLEEAWKTLEHAGHAGPDIVGARVGVFAGCSSGDYHDLFGADVPGQAFWGNTSSLVPARIAYFLDLKGPAVAVDTACSSSLVAVHLACRALWNEECDMALAGGVFVQCTPRFFRSANQANMLSPSGNCAAFGANADGIVPGEAVGAVLLRPLDQALADGDTIHGVIVASGTNQDGTTNGITAPSAQSQERLIRSVYQRFAVDPASIGLIEAHGTGTPLGDPIEHAALSRAFAGQPVGSVLLGSVKSNIGHATTAAGIASLIKVLLSLEHDRVPPTLHFNGGNAAIRFAETPFTVNTSPQPWPHRRAAISSFGFSGTNAHVVVDPPPALPTRAPVPGPFLFVIGGRNADLLRRQAEVLATHLETHPDLAAADVAFTLMAGRRPSRHRLVVIATDTADLTTRLRRWLAGDPNAVVGAGEITDQPAPLGADTDLHGLGRAMLTGADVAVERLFPQGGQRVPLPATLLATTRCWVETAAPPSIPAPTPKAAALPFTLPAATILAGPFVPRPPAKISLTPVGNAPRIQRKVVDGVLHLDVAGHAQSISAELAAASADETIHAVAVSGSGFGPLPACDLPVVADASFSGADFTAADAPALAAQIAQAPRLALVELKRNMARPGRVPDLTLPQWDALWSEAASAPVWQGADTPLTLPHEGVEMRLFDDGVVLLRMVERVDKNCFTDALMDALVAAFDAIAALDRAKVVVLTGFDGYFACGGTRSGLQSLQQGATSFTDRKIYSLPLACPLPVIAAMQGHAIGAGWSLGLFCDHAVFAAEGVYHSNYLWYGFTPGAGATLVFPARLGDALGREVLFTAREYRGRELAERHAGLDVRPAAQVLDHALGLAHGLARQPRQTLRDLKAQAIRPLTECLETVFAEELAMHAKTFIGNKRVQERIEQMFPAAPVAPAPRPQATSPDLRRKVVDSLAEELMIESADIHDASGFLELGLDSILAVTWIRKLNSLLGTDLPATAVYAQPTIGALVAHLSGQAPTKPAPEPEPVPTPEPVTVSPPTELRRQVVNTLAQDLMIDSADIHDASGFLELGLDSILAVTWIRKLNALLATDLPATAIYAHPTVGALVAHLSGLRPAVSEPVPFAPMVAPVVAPVTAAAPRRDRAARDTSDAVAIIGASGRFPRSRDLHAFWDNIRAGRDCIDEVPQSRWDVSRFYHPDPTHPGTASCKWMGVIDDIECFEPGFFNLTPREAELMDPQQRLFLEHSWQAFEDAGLDPSALAGSRCGVFVGAGPSGYGERITERNSYSLLGSSGSILAARIAHLLDLRGPCISLDTACSSSLVAIAEACNSLLVGDSDMVLAGGVCVMIGPKMFIDTSKVNMLSKDGRCFSFDGRANGFVPGEGAGVLLLKRLDDALRDADPIHAVIRGWGVNQDGRTNGITAPNPQAQTRLIRDVHQRFGIAPASIGMIECHGTGTPLGDPIEVEGLTDAFAGSGAKPASCALGSVKSNMGHMLAAAGVAGVMKAMLAVERGEVPPTIQFQSLNEHIRLDGTPFAVNTTLRPWSGGEPRRAGVSSFGFSGTNAHIVVESPPPASSGRHPGPWVLTLSARTPERLVEMAAALHRFVTDHPELDLGDVAHTLQVGRKAQTCRLAAVFAHRDALLRTLGEAAAGRVPPGAHQAKAGPSTANPFDDDDGRALIGKWLVSADVAKLDKVAALWAQGGNVDWRVGPVGRRLHLPGTIFARDRHWVEDCPENQIIAAHPLLDGSSGSASVTLLADDALTLALHLPELARATAERIGGRPVRALAHLMWGALSPLGSRRLESVVEADEQGWLYRISAENRPLSPLHLGELAEMPDFPAALAPAQLRSGDDVSEAFNQTHPRAEGMVGVWRQGSRLTAELHHAPSAMLFDPLLLKSLWQLLDFHLGAENVPLAADMLAANGPVAGKLFLRIDTAPGARHPDLTVFDAQGQPRLIVDGIRTAPISALPEIHLDEVSQS
ncbi:MAG: SDR family NAD(P)-dependent oxidoreductase [Magnetospirillum sp.]